MDKYYLESVAAKMHVLKDVILKEWDQLIYMINFYLYSWCIKFFMPFLMLEQENTRKSRLKCMENHLRIKLLFLLVCSFFEWLGLSSDLRRLWCPKCTDLLFSFFSFPFPFSSFPSFIFNSSFICPFKYSSTFTYLPFLFSPFF